MATPIHRELAQWLHDRVRDGIPREDVAKLLADGGYDHTTVERACTLAYEHPADLQTLIDPAFHAEAASQTTSWLEEFVPAARLPLAETRNRVPADHGDIQVLARSERPYVMALGNVLTKDECAELIDYSRDRMTRATVVSPIDGGDEVDERRTSELVMLKLAESPLIARIDARLEALTGIPAPHGEGLQVMRYGVGAEYQSHYDFFDAGSLGERRHLRYGQRVATVVIYLNDVEGGGETIFPNGDLAVAPHTGNASYFAYTDANGRCDSMSFHGGAPVTAGEKWIATKWLRDRPYVSDPNE